ncbi:unnamed protein product [Moneuplotes crassus]|uniref:Protein kinase domain-containing protein n=1 Tax=Euplotes crassus TaxID=5936 RepID=A0AAD1U8Q0_EUPCR|nr:unnamed protein product [Moneuplotes crassus]
MRQNGYTTQRGTAGNHKKKTKYHKSSKSSYMTTREYKIPDSSYQNIITNSPNSTNRVGPTGYKKSKRNPVHKASRIVPSSSEISLCSTTSHKYGANFNLSSRFGKKPRPHNNLLGAGMNSKCIQSQKELSQRQNLNKNSKLSTTYRYNVDDKALLDLKHKCSSQKILDKKPRPNTGRESKEISPLREINMSTTAPKNADYLQHKLGYTKPYKKIQSSKNTIEHKHKIHKNSSRNSKNNSEKRTVSKRKASVSNPRKKLIVKQSSYRKLGNEKPSGRMVHTARINLTQNSKNTSSFIESARAPITNLKKYSCIAAKEVTTGCQSSRNKINMSKSDKCKRSSKDTKHNHKRDSSKRKRSKRREILEYLEDCFQNDDHEISSEKTYNERLAILQEFLGYLEEKDIINKKVLNNAGEVEKLIKGLMKIDLSKICANQNKDQAQSKNYHKENNYSQEREPEKRINNYFREREKHSVISPSHNKENMNSDNSLVKAKKSSKAGNHTRRLSQHSQVEEQPSKNSYYFSSHNRNYSTGSILQLKEIDGNQIINQKVGHEGGNNTHRAKDYRPSSVIYQSEYSLHNTQKNEIPKPVISVSNKMNNTNMMPTPVFSIKEEQKYEPAIYCSSDSSSTVTMVYNRGTASSSGSADRNSRRLSENNTKSKDSLRNQKFNSIKEVDESSSDYEAGEKTIQATFNKYNLNDNQSVRRVQARDNLLQDEQPQDDLYNEEDMKTKKNYDEFYPEYENIQNLHDSLENYEAQSSVEQRGNLSRRPRVSSTDQEQPTIIRNKSQPEIIPEYDITRRVPYDKIHSSKNKKISDFNYGKYSDKYSLTKNCKYFGQIQRNKPLAQEVNAKAEQQDSLEEKFADIKKRNHRRVASANYNCAKILAKKITTKDSQKQSPYKEESKNESKSNEKYMYRNYISNRNPVNLKSFKKQQKRQSKKRTSCHNTKETQSTVSKLSLTLSDSIMEDREKLVKFIKLYSKKHKKIPPTSLDFYKIVKLIGKGAFGKVTLGIHKLTGKQVAIKTIEKEYMKDEFSRRKVFQEVYILKKTRHSNVIRLFEVFESTNHFLIVMEYAGRGDLLQHVKNKGRLREKEARHFFKNILYGLGHCHCRSVLHRDVKLDNILIDEKKGVKICDFGVSKIIKKNQKINEQCGTPAYIAPEIIADKGYYGFYVDIWSLGILLYAMVCGAVPFKAGNMQELYENIINEGFSFPVCLSKPVKDLIRKMLNKVPEKRILIPDILTHEWVTSSEDFEIDYDEETENTESDLESSALLSNCSDKRRVEDTDGRLDNLETEGTGPTHENINYVNVDNLFYSKNYENKLGYDDYKSLTEDFATMNIEENALEVIEGFGYPRSLVKKSINKGEMNHATTCYDLLVKY